MGVSRLSFWRFWIWPIFAIVSFVPNSVTVSGTSCNIIQAAFRDRGLGKTYFLSKGEYIEYSLRRESEARIGPISELGLDARGSHPDAAFTLPNDTLLIIKECRYFMYIPGDDGRWALQSEGQNFGGLPCSPDAALAPEHGNITVFKGCQVWRFSNETETFSEDGHLSDLGLPCDVDTAVQWSPGETIFIRGTSFWRRQDDDLSGPFHTDDLNLCSWYLCGEADWMAVRNQGRFPCNGDRRLCGLRLNQVTLPGLHNAGAGFDGGFAFLDCFLRNHARTVEEQLQLGIRYLDIDSSYWRCGVLGSHHSSFCGGSICRLLKQTRSFLSRNPHDVIVLTFNHEMEDAQIVMPALTRQLKSQLGPMLNRGFRARRMSRWPKLRYAVRTNQRVFVFYAPEVQDEPFGREVFRPNQWINTEAWLGSTWTEFSLNGGNCSQIVQRTAYRCDHHQSRQLVEVSIVPTVTFGSCIESLAEECRHFHHAALRSCETFRFRHGRSPNVLLVDYPEVQPDHPNSVFQAVHHQNVRNLLAHRPNTCRVRVDAAVRRPGMNDQVLFFVGSKVIVYSHSLGAQIQEIPVPGITSVDAAYVSLEGDIIVIKDCESVALASSSLAPLTTTWTAVPACDPRIDATTRWGGDLYVFQGCYMTTQGQQPISLRQLGLPCDVDAALTFNDELFVFSGNIFWGRRQGEATFSWRGSTLDWTIDVVVC